MKNVKNAHYWQIDNRIKNISAAEGVIILASSQAWQKFSWTRKWFEKKPKEGYFVWAKGQPRIPLTTCVTIASPKISQNLDNLLVIEKNIKVKASVVCNASKKNLYGKHQAKGKLILKKGASLEYTHNHFWGKEDFVNPEYEFILEKDSRLAYDYRNLFPPKNLKLKTIINCQENSSANIRFVINGINSKADLEEKIFLEGRKSQGMIKLRLVGKKNSLISGKSSIIALSAGKGHLDCQGLLVDKKSEISMVPELVCKDPKAQITHEALIGKISEEEINYLRTKGLAEKEAIDLIVGGFLRI